MDAALFRNIAQDAHAISKSPTVLAGEIWGVCKLHGRELETAKFEALKTKAEFDKKPILSLPVIRNSNRYLYG